MIRSNTVNEQFHKLQKSYRRLRRMVNEDAEYPLAVVHNETLLLVERALQLLLLTDPAQGEALEPIPVIWQRDSENTRGAES